VKQANEMIELLHRHHKRVVSHRFSLGCFDEAGVLHGAVVVGRPVARGVDPYAVAEVTRLVTDGTSNACSLLYGAAARAAKAMGFDRIQTYILDSEPGTSLLAAGWQFDHTTAGGSWDTPSRARTDKAPVVKKKRYARDFTDTG
jgi:hypothetical protein